MHGNHNPSTRKSVSFASDMLEGWSFAACKASLNFDDQFTVRLGFDTLPLCSCFFPTVLSQGVLCIDLRLLLNPQHPPTASLIISPLSWSIKIL